MTSSTDAVTQGLLDRLIEFGEEFHSIEPKIKELRAEIDRLEARKAELGKLGNALVDAAHAFNFDLRAAYNSAAGSPRVPEMMSDAPKESQPEQPRRPSIKKFVQRAAQAAYPAPVRASSIRADLAAQGEDVHEKTVGMTLYRLLKKGVLRRQGFDWYFVPENERTAQEEGAEA